MGSFDKPPFSPDAVEPTGGESVKPEREVAEPVIEKKKKPEPILKKEEIGGIKEYAKKVIQYWHDEFKPDYVFLNETSAVPLGYVLKEAYSEAYGNEVIPLFF